VKGTILNRVVHGFAQLKASSAPFLFPLMAVMLPSWSWGGDVQPANPFAVQQFSATKVTTIPREKYGVDVADMTSKIYKSGDKLREDLPTIQIPGLPPHLTGYTLTSLNENTFYEVHSGQCVLQTSAMLVVLSNPFAAMGEVTRKELGSEVVDGHPTKITQISITKGHDKFEYKAWLATDLHDFPVRVETTTSTTYTYKDVSLSDPPASLFATPTNCTKVNNSKPLMQVVPAQPKSQSK
jgi:hypothetical protein